MGNVASALSAEHRDFYDRFRAFWTAPSGARVAELIAPHAQIHFTGVGSFTGKEYKRVMADMLESMQGLKVTPVDCAGDGERLYIFWNASAKIEGVHRAWLGVDRFRIVEGMAIEEYVIFDPTALRAPA